MGSSSSSSSSFGTYILFFHAGHSNTPRGWRPVRGARRFINDARQTGQFTSRKPKIERGEEDDDETKPNGFIPGLGSERYR